jgi:hypothetical protein
MIVPSRSASLSRCVLALQMDHVVDSACTASASTSSDRFASGLSPDPFQNIPHFMDDLAALRRFTRLVVRVGLEERLHLIRHAHQLMVRSSPSFGRL